jgi:2-desacetyl-2-hydroxyethyl bacteriochlorophyllide A dehydrogenase
VTHVKEGDRVGIGIAPACGKCPACAAGDPDHCFPAAGGLIGLGPLAASHGGFAPAIAFEAARLVRIRGGISGTAAAMLEPATVALHAVHRTGVRMGDGCLVLGAGPIGLLTMQCAFAAGAGAVAVSEPHPARRAEAAALGATAIIDPRTEIPAERCREIFGAVGPDVVFECAGVPGTLQLAADLARRGGTVSLVGLASRPEEITPAIWLAKEITMVASLAYVSHEFEHTMALMQDGRLRTDPLHTSTVGLAELGGAFERLHDEPEEIKILVDPHA